MKFFAVIISFIILATMERLGVSKDIYWLSVCILLAGYMASLKE